MSTPIHSFRRLAATVAACLLTASPCLFAQTVTDVPLPNAQAQVKEAAKAVRETVSAAEAGKLPTAEEIAAERARLEKMRAQLAAERAALENGEVKIELGQPGKQAGNAAFMALEAAVNDLKKGVIDVLVTAPISKENIHSEAFSFPGHTEYLETSLGNGKKALMVLCSEAMKVALVTTHVPVAKIAQSINKDVIVEKLHIFNDSLQRDFNIQKPRIAVLGLNPHCGDNGVIGSEEKEIIEPAIQQANDEQVLCFGPYAADGFFGNSQYRRFDGVLAMYHDQGLAPFKAIAMDDGVNVTAGLPFVRTSPDHGTGYDIAGQGIASEKSMRQAIFTAIDIFGNRNRWDEMYQNPLKKQYFDKGKDNVVLDLTKIENEDPMG